MSFLTLFLVFLLFMCISSSNGARLMFYENEIQSSIKNDQDGGLCALLVRTQGYNCEEHQVITKDGYILGVHRIPQGHNSNSNSQSNPIPILLQHGIVSDARRWLSSPSTSQSLGFVLADAGYDVWISNTRGTNYSRGHTSLSSSDPAYWDWSWDELVSYDLPALVQYVHDKTGKNLHYVGHSLGTLLALAAFSQGNVYTMLRSAGMLSPIAYTGHVRSALIQTAPRAYIGEKMNSLGFSQFDPQGKSGSDVLKIVCDLPGINDACTDIVSSITGPNCCLDPSTVIALGFPATSTKNIVHLSQMVRSDTIIKHDYGNEEDNNKHYGQPNPPAYTMANIPKDFPLFMSYGGQDYMSDVDDVHKLLDDLKDHQPDKLIVQYKDNYGHLDFVHAGNAKEQVYDALMNFLKSH